MTGAGTGVRRAASLALMMPASPWCSPDAAWRCWKKPKLGDNVGKSAVSADMTSPGSIARCSPGDETYGRLDVLFNNAGMGAPPVNTRISASNNGRGGEYQPHRAVPAQHAFRIMKDQIRAAPHHQQRLDLGARAAAFSAAYTSTKHAITGLTRPPTSMAACTISRSARSTSAMPQPNDGPHGCRPRRDAARWHDETRAAHGREGGRRRGRLHGRPAAGRQRAVHDGHGEQDAVCRAGVSNAAWAQLYNRAVMPREGGASSTPRLLDLSLTSLEYWIARIQPGDDTERE